MQADIYELTAPQLLTLKQQSLALDSLPTGTLAGETVYSVVSPGTELAAWSGKPPLRPSVVYPRVVGYCNVARVIALGPDVPAGIAVGDYILTHQSHRSHFVIPHADVLVCVKQADDASLRKLASTYLYHLAYVALRAGDFEVAQRVAVVGLGALGFAAASLALALGATPIVLSGRTSAELRSLIPNAEFVAKNDPDAVAQFARADIVVNTSDSWDDYRSSLTAARRGGRILLLGFPGRGLALPDFNPLDSSYLYDKQLTIKQTGQLLERGDASPGLQLRRNLSELWSMLSDGRLDPTPLIAYRASWRALPEVYRNLSLRMPGKLSALLEWSERSVRAT